TAQRWLLAVALVLAGAITVAAVIAGNGDVGVALAPLLGATVLIGLWWVPLRIPLLALIGLALALDAEGPWASPLAPFGHLLLINLNKPVPVDALAFSAAAAGIVYLAAIAAVRRLTTSRAEVKAIGAPQPLYAGFAISILGIALEIANGVVTGGDL